MGRTAPTRSVRFFATTGDDENYRVDGMDATSIRNQNMRLNSRLLMSEDAIAEFRVNSAAFTADSGGSIVGQVEVVTKSGSNALHGSAFEYARNAVFDARPFTQPGSLPPFGFNQYGGTVGGAIQKNRTFFFLSYEGLRQTQNLQSAVQEVPSLSFRAQALAESPVIAPLLAAFPNPTGSTSNPQIGTWSGPVQNLQDEDVGTVRVDHRFNDSWSSYFRFTRNNAFVRIPDSLNYGTEQLQRAGKRSPRVPQCGLAAHYQRDSPWRQLGPVADATETSGMCWQSPSARSPRRRTPSSSRPIRSPKISSTMSRRSAAGTP